MIEEIAFFYILKSLKPNTNMSDTSEKIEYIDNLFVSSLTSISYQPE